jgi:hypothetical protein
MTYSFIYVVIWFCSYLFAERVGFKPTVQQSRTTDFESVPIDHSGIFPLTSLQIYSFLIFVAL